MSAQLSTSAVPSGRSAVLPQARNDAEYTLAVPADARRDLARGWLALGLAALILSGVFSILLVLARTPGVNKLLPSADFFRVALVVHVDLSVLVWFIAVAGVLWSLISAPRAFGLAWAALGLAAAGCSRRVRSRSDVVFQTGVPVPLVR